MRVRRTNLWNARASVIVITARALVTSRITAVQGPIGTNILHTLTVAQMVTTRTLRTSWIAHRVCSAIAATIFLSGAAHGRPQRSVAFTCPLVTIVGRIQGKSGNAIIRSANIGGGARQ